MGNKKIAIPIIAGLFIVLMVALSAGFYISYQLSESSKKEYFWSSKEAAKHHILVLLDDSTQAYGDAFVRGIEEAGESYQIAAEVIKIEGNNYKNDVLQRLDMAMYMEVDGVILHAFDDEDLASKINALSDANIPVITLNEDLPETKRISYVGVNRYTIGQAAGMALAKEMEDEGKIAVIEQRSFSSAEFSSEDMMILGLTDVLKEYPNLKLGVVRYTEEGVLSAETVASRIIKEYPDVNGIFCTDGQNTLGAVQVLLDNNLVNDNVLVGYSDDDEILSYIQKGNIIEASIATNYADVGREAINAFNEYFEVGFVSSYVNTPLQVIDMNTVDDYIREKSEQNGEIE